ncbi:MAG TPA: hypothetical protein VK586_08260 [Streptosporangiaceae bacterium]|nr:hypothetical protein [Streptosporangiaceae bacterium]
MGRGAGDGLLDDAAASGVVAGQQGGRKAQVGLRAALQVSAQDFLDDGLGDLLAGLGKGHRAGVGGLVLCRSA